MSSVQIQTLSLYPAVAQPEKSSPIDLCSVSRVEKTGFASLFQSAASRLQQSVEEARRQALTSVLKIQLSGEDRGKLLEEGIPSELFSLRLNPMANDGPFLQGTLRLAKRIERKEMDLDQVRHEMSELMGSTAYQKGIDTDHPAVNFLQFLSIKLFAADGEALLADHSRRELKGCQKKRTYTVGDLADRIGARLKSFFPLRFNHDSLINRFLWIVLHPVRAWHALQSERYGVHGYNPNHGNPSYLGPRFELSHEAEKKAMQAYYGPCPTGDRVFEFGLLPAYKKLGLFEIYFNYQDMTHKQENARIREIDRIASEHPETLLHVVLGFDAKVKAPEMKALIHQFSTVDQFVQGYQDFVMKRGRSLDGGAGISIPRSLLSDEQLSGIFESAKEFYHELGLAIPESPSQKKKSAEMMIHDIDARIAAACLYQAFKRVPSNPIPGLDQDLASCYVSARCKQHIDRGAVQSNTLRLYFRMFENDSELSEREFDEIAGGILGRALNVEDRHILHHRYERFDHLMRFIGDQHSALAASLRKYRDKHLAE